jgi:roadblock/LC7 domain-containing protein
MGFFKDIKKLSDQGKQIREQYPVSQQMANAQASMAQASAMMANMATASAGGVNAVANGVAAVATIVAARQTGAMMNYNPVVDLELLVMMPSGVPMPVTKQGGRACRSTSARCQPGMRLNVKVDPNNINSIWIDWVTPVY